MTTLLACGALTLILAVYIFFPEKKVTAQTEKSRREYLEERKAALYENLRDLSFEHRAGKYRDDEYEGERTALELEAAGVVAELDELERRQPGHRAAAPTGASPSAAGTRLPGSAR